MSDKKIFTCNLDDILEPKAPKEESNEIEELVMVGDRVGFNIRAVARKNTGEIFPTVWIHVFDANGDVQLKLFYALTANEYKGQYGGHSKTAFMTIFKQPWARLLARKQEQLRNDGSVAAVSSVSNSEDVPY